MTIEITFCVGRIREILCNENHENNIRRPLYESATSLLEDYINEKIF